MRVRRALSGETDEVETTLNDLAADGWEVAHMSTAWNAVNLLGFLNVGEVAVRSSGGAIAGWRTGPNTSIGTNVNGQTERRSGGSAYVMSAVRSREVQQCLGRHVGLIITLAMGMDDKRDNQSSLLAGNARTALPLYYWSVICGLTVGLSLLPTLEFLKEIRHQHGGTAAAILVLVSVFGTQFIVSKLQGGYFDIRPFESDGRFYEMLGVRLFRFLVPMGDGINRLVRRFQPDYRIVSKQSIADFEKRTVTAETFHVACLLTIVPSAVYSVVLGWWPFTLLLTVPNTVLHLYPVLLQRYTRARILRLRSAPANSPAVPLSRFSGRVSRDEGQGTDGERK